MKDFLQTSGLMKMTHTKPRTGPIICETCGKEWLEDCDCGQGVNRNIFAFHDNIGGTYKVWSCEDVIFLEWESDKKTDTILFGTEDLTRVAQMWLALQESDSSTHDHHFSSTLDPHYEACSCGAARKKP